MAQRCLVVDLDRCSGCHGCTAACKFENDLGLGTYRCDVVEMGPFGTHPDITQYWLPMYCQQCTNAPCVEVCPTGASYRDENGVVLVEAESCIGCKSCLTACPYSDPDGAMRPSARWMTKENVVTKCTLCNHLTATSDGVENPEDTFDPAHAVPPCVHNCCNGARFFGDLEDPNSGASKAVAQAESEGKGIYQLEADGAQPAALYILSEATSSWHDLSEGYVLYAKG